MLLLTIIAACMLTNPEWIGPPGRSFHGKPPSWVWTSEGKPTTDNAPAGPVWLGREFDVPEAAQRRIGPPSG